MDKARVIALFKEKQFENSLYAAESLLKRSPRDPELLFVAGNASFFLERTQKALNYFKTLNAFSSAFSGPAAAMEVKCLRALKRWGEAQERIKGWTELQGHPALIQEKQQLALELARLALDDLREGRNERAEERLTSALILSQAPEIQMALGIFYFEEEDDTQAEAFFVKIMADAQAAAFFYDAEKYVEMIRTRKVASRKSARAWLDTAGGYNTNKLLVTSGTKKSGGVGRAEFGIQSKLFEWDQPSLRFEYAFNLDCLGFGDSCYALSHSLFTTLSWQWEKWGLSLYPQGSLFHGSELYLTRAGLGIDASYFLGHSVVGMWTSVIQTIPDKSDYDYQAGASGQVVPYWRWVRNQFWLELSGLGSFEDGGVEYFKDSSNRNIPVAYYGGGGGIAAMWMAQTRLEFLASLGYEYRYYPKEQTSNSTQPAHREDDVLRAKLKMTVPIVKWLRFYADTQYVVNESNSPFHRSYNQLKILGGMQWGPRRD